MRMVPITGTSVGVATPPATDAPAGVASRPHDRESLDTIESGAFARIVEVALEFAVKERLAALGLRQGRQVEVVRRLGRRGPIQVRTGATDVLLRGGEAARIWVLSDPLAAEPQVAA